MIERLKHKKINKVIGLLAIFLLTLSLYFIFFFQNLKIEIFNRTNYDIDSLNIADNFFHIKKGTSLFIENCKSISIQAGLPFGLPEAKIKGKNRDDSRWDFCGTGVKKIKRGKYKFDIMIMEDGSSYTLYWEQHK